MKEEVIVREPVLSPSQKAVFVFVTLIVLGEICFLGSLIFLITYAKAW